MRLIVAVSLCLALLACQPRESAVNSLMRGVPETVKGVSASGAEPAPEALNLQLPREYDSTQINAWELDARGRYRVGEWFSAGGVAQGSRFKVKSKLLLKESKELKRSFSSYAENVNGAEIGFEYKTR